MVTLTRFLLLCASVLVLPAIAAAQPAPLAIERVWTQKAGYNETAFSPGDTIQFMVQLNNSYGGSLLSAELTITTPFYNNTATLDIPAGRSTQTWTATAPPQQDNYTFTVKVYDSFYGRYAEASANLTVTSQPASTRPHIPGWYYNGAGTIPNILPILFQDTKTGLQITWQNSYIYQYPGDSALYWYAEIVYSNLGSNDVPVNCIGMTDPSLFKEHMRGTANAGYVAASETFCSRNKTFSTYLKPKHNLYQWAIFHNVPWQGGEVRLEWGIYGFSPWVDPWHSPYPSNTPQPTTCPPELVTLKTCQPERGAPPVYYCLGEQCNTPRPPSDIPNYPIESGMSCVAEFLGLGLKPTGDRLLEGLISFSDFVNDVGAPSLAVIEDVLTKERCTVPINALQFVPFESCVETIVDFLAPGQLDALRHCLAARTKEEQVCLQNIVDQTGIQNTQSVVSFCAGKS